MSLSSLWTCRVAPDLQILIKCRLETSPTIGSPAEGDVAIVSLSKVDEFPNICFDMLCKVGVETTNLRCWQRPHDNNNTRVGFSLQICTANTFRTHTVPQGIFEKLETSRTEPLILHPSRLPHKSAPSHTFPLGLAYTNLRTLLCDKWHAQVEINSSNKHSDG